MSENQQTLVKQWVGVRVELPEAQPVNMKVELLSDSIIYNDKK